MCSRVHIACGIERPTTSRQDACRAKVLHHMQTSPYHEKSRSEGVDLQMLAATAELHSDTYEYSEKDPMCRRTSSQRFAAERCIRLSRAFELKCDM